MSTVVMNDELIEMVARRFKAMSEPTRLKILQTLKEGEKSVSEIASHTGLKHGTASSNLLNLQQSGLVSNRREGTRVLYRISDPIIFQICDIVCDSIKVELNQYAELSKALNY